MSAVFNYEIRATHQNGRKISRPLVITNESTFRRAQYEFARLKDTLTNYRLVLVERLITNEERVIA